MRGHSRRQRGRPGLAKALRRRHLTVLGPSGESGTSQRAARLVPVRRPVTGGGPVRSARPDVWIYILACGCWTYQGRRYALEEPTEPLLARDSRKRMEGRAVLNVRRWVLETVLHCA